MGAQIGDKQPGFYDGKEILITGGTGSLGKALVRQLLAEHRPKGIRIFSRDELKQYHMHNDIKQWPSPSKCPVAFLVGDVRCYDRLRRAFKSVDVIIHAAAMKQVPACEQNPLEAIQTNVLGAVNVLNAAIDCGVERVMNVSTDKAAKPVNLYGATKMSAEKLFIDGNVYTGGHGTRFASCRYGNVLGSRGSVAHVFRAQVDAGLPITLTHKAMTRFWITLPDAARFVLARTAEMQGGETFVPRMKSMGIYEMARAILVDSKKALIETTDFKDIGIRQGEKLHEILFTREDYVYEFGDHYRVFAAPRIGEGYGRAEQWELASNRNPNGNIGGDELLAMITETGL
jgi:UDP-N-acetylglucosamine 4,6-dehydratase